MAIPLSVRRSIGVSSLRNIVHRMIEDQYRARTPGSAALYAQACRVLPAGLTHDSRATSPYPIYVARAAGARKWDVDGNEYVDYFGGHGALLFGHSHPPLVEAVPRRAGCRTTTARCLSAFRNRSSGKRSCCLPTMRVQYLIYYKPVMTSLR